MEALFISSCSFLWLAFYKRGLYLTELSREIIHLLPASALVQNMHGPGNSGFIHGLQPCSMKWVKIAHLLSDYLQLRNHHLQSLYPALHK